MPTYDLICPDGHKQLDIVHSIHDSHPPCPTCGQPTQTFWTQAPGVATDDIPGGIDIRHGICWPDGTPRKFYSKSAIRKAAFEAGLTIAGETPNPNQRLVEADQAKRERSEQS